MNIDQLELREPQMQIVPFGLPLPSMPFRTLPLQICIYMAYPMAPSWPQVSLTPSNLSKRVWDTFSSAAPQINAFSPPKRLKLTDASRKVARALPFSLSETPLHLAASNVVPPLAPSSKKKVKRPRSKVPVSIEYLRRSPRLLGLALKADLNIDTPQEEYNCPTHPPEFPFGC
uniref:Uncharacterized protein n=1 Tax=Oryza punctata TaxID=4537 RepID=A0A0E0KM87_ORYPU